jgi:hypothetical protein
VALSSLSFIDFMEYSSLKLLHLCQWARGQTQIDAGLDNTMRNHDVILSKELANIQIHGIQCDFLNRRAHCVCIDVDLAGPSVFCLRLGRLSP